MGAPRKVSNNKKLKEFGEHLKTLIRRRGYKSAYDFWIERAGDDISRMTLHYIITGQREPKLFTLILLMDLLEVTPQEFFNFGERKKR